jgi:hypothetical protein
MIVLVLILVPAVTISIMNQMPDDRTPTVMIKMGPLNDGTVSLYHKGGDWIKTDSIKITRNGEVTGFTCQNPVFDLGNSIITAQGIESGDKISLIVKNSVVFSGVAYP